MKKHIACQIEYHGGFTVGWQEQPELRSLAADVKRALQQFCAEDLDLLCAGRTDKGVHATGQVISFITTTHRALFQWKMGLNHFLPPYIRIIDVCEVALDFHPRFSATARTYRYYCSLVSSVHTQGIVTPLYRQPSLELMNQAARSLLGTHDFHCFQGGSCQAKTSIRTCSAAQWMERGSLLCFEITANAFLHHMVRYLVGCLLQMGFEEKGVEWFETLVQGQGTQDFCAPGDGLYLSHVHYPKEEQIPFVQRYPWFDSIA